tara:strand:+ start:931 stop:1110 length:180 start_codon:yes stop_codon:yes gene_type:complete
MELKEIAKIMPLVLRMISKQEFEDKELYFVYGQEEYTKDLTKVKKQFKRQLKNTFRLWR